MVHDSDSNILSLLRKDKATSIRMLFEKYYLKLVIYAEFNIKDRNIAEDIVQEFFVKLLEDNYLKTVSSTALRSYLFTSVRNSCRTYLSKKDTLKDFLDISEVEIPDEVFANIDEERINKIMSEIELLPERTRMAVQNVMLKGKKYKDVATEMGISVNTVKFLLKEGTKRLRERLSEDTLNLYFFLSSKII